MLCSLVPKKHVREEEVGRSLDGVDGKPRSRWPRKTPQKERISPLKMSSTKLGGNTACVVVLKMFTDSLVFILLLRFVT